MRAATATALNVNRQHYLNTHMEGRTLVVYASLAVRDWHSMWQPVQAWLDENQATLVSECQRKDYDMVTSWAVLQRYEPAS